MSETKAEKAVEKVADNVHKYRDGILIALGLLGVLILVWWLLRNYRLMKAAEKVAS